MSSGIATFTTSALTAGAHTAITAEFLGDSSFNGSTAPNLTQTVNQAGTTISVSPSTTSSIYGQSLTFTATVGAVGPARGLPTGTVGFFDGASELGTGTLGIGGTATFSTSTIPAGSNAITAEYLGDSNFTASTSSVLTLTVSQASTMTAVSSSVNPSGFGQSVTFTAAISVVAPGAGNPTGTVEFFDGATEIGSGGVSGGTASFSTPALTVEAHSITAQYIGDNNFTGSTSSILSQTVNQATTSTTVSSSVNPSYLGQSVTYTAAVVVVSPGAGTPTGTVEFFDGATDLGSGTLVNAGTATFTTSTLSVGSHSITAVYGGDTDFLGGTSNVLTQSVNSAATTTTLVSSLDPSVFGQSVSLTATVAVVAPGTGVPTGSVEFFDGSTLVDTETLVDSGTVTFSTSSLTAGIHSTTAEYVSNNDFGDSTSTALPQTVNQASTTTSLSSSVNPSAFGQSVTFTAAIAVVAPGAGTPTGSVEFFDGGSEIGSASVIGDSATFSTTTLSVGGHSITAQYLGNTDFSGSTSASTSQTVSQASTAATVSGQLFEDDNQNGQLDGTESGLAGWTIKLLNGNNQLVASSITDSSGNYVIADLEPGTYTAVAVLQPGYVYTAPASGSHSLSATSGALLSGTNFGVFKTVSLAATGLSTSPSSGLQSGTSLAVQWSDTNTGTLPAAGSFTDMIIATNTTTGQVLTTASVPYNATTLGNLAAGASASQQYAFRLPDGNPGVGQIQITVTADVYDNVSTPQGDPSKTATLTETSTLAPYPDLVASDVTATTTAYPGEQTSVGWTLTNSGSASATGPWTEQVLLATDFGRRQPDPAVRPNLYWLPRSRPVGPSVDQRASPRSPPRRLLVRGQREPARPSL